MVSTELAASAGGLVYLNNDADAVRSLAFIQWHPAPPAAAGQPPRMATTQGILGLALLPAAHPDQSPAGDAARAMSPPCFGFNAAGWQQILDEFQASGIFARRFTTVSLFHEALSSTRFPNPQALMFTDAALNLGHPVSVEYVYGFQSTIPLRRLSGIVDWKPYTYSTLTGCPRLSAASVNIRACGFGNRVEDNAS